MNDGSEVSRLLQRADALYSSFRSEEALSELLKILELEPQNHEALSKISRVYIDLGDRVPEYVPDSTDKKLQQYRTAERYARKAIEAGPEQTWGHFYVAASLGKIAMLSPVSQQIDLAREIRARANKALSLDPMNGYAYHVLGVWHRRVAGIGQVRRILASTILWRSVPQGSLEKSIEYLKKAVSLNPKIISHHLELAQSYMAVGKWQLARSHLKKIQEFPIQFSDDPIHKENAQRLLQEIKGN